MPPATGYSIYSKEVRKQVKAENPRVRHQTIVITKKLRSQLISDEHARYKT